jgi:hypothetical protein
MPIRDTEFFHRLPQVGLGQVAITQCHTNVPMSQELLHRLQVRAAHHHVARKCVSQIVKATVGNSSQLAYPRERVGY